jgi:hypothetical protein
VRGRFVGALNAKHSRIAAKNVKSFIGRLGTRWIANRVKELKKAMGASECE